jgi:hypothetical protein
MELRFQRQGRVGHQVVAASEVDAAQAVLVVEHLLLAKLQRSRDHRSLSLVRMAIL